MNIDLIKKECENISVLVIIYQNKSFSVIKNGKMFPMNITHYIN